MTETPKKRPWFQYHLSTALLLMLVVSILLGFNTVQRQPLDGYYTFGWPVPFGETTYWATTYQQAEPHTLAIPFYETKELGVSRVFILKWKELGIDLFSNFCIAAAVLCIYPGKVLRLKLYYTNLIAILAVVFVFPILQDFYIHGRDYAPYGYISVCVSLILLTAWGSECLIRRKERQREQRA